MAYKKGTATGYLDLLFMLHNFVTSSVKVSEPIKYPTNTGDGWVTAEWADDSSGYVLDDWEIEMLTATTFKLTGADSSHGLQVATGALDVPYVSDNGEVGFKISVGDTAFIAGDIFNFSTVAGLPAVQKWGINRYNMVYDGSINYAGLNVGNGSIGNPNYDMYAPDETWTIICTTSGSSGVPAVFSVEGSISGAKANATADVPYDNGLVSFTITTGTTEWDAGSASPDTIDFDVPVFREVMYEAPGNAGTEEIFMGIKTFYALAAEPIYQWRLNGWTGFNPPADFINQPGGITNEGSSSGVPRCLMQNRDMKYWIVANGRRVTMFYEVEEVVETMYLGFLLQYGIPTENPYPLAVGGTTLYDNQAYPSTSHYHRAWFDGSCSQSNNPAGSQLQVFDGSTWNRIAGHGTAYTWAAVAANHGVMWPYFTDGTGYSWANTSTDDYWVSFTINDNGSYPLFPLIPCVSLPNKMVFGEMEGVYAVPGLSLNKKDTTTIDAVEYIFFSNTWRTAQDSYACLRLE